MAHLQLIGSVLFNVASYVVYKSIVGAAPHIWWPMFGLGLALGGLNTFLFARSIKTFQLSVAYPVFSGACFALITLISAMAFDERVSAMNIIGIGLMLVGIVLATQ